jgi:transcriptional regulator GlxA family with amidase domain
MLRIAILALDAVFDSSLALTLDSLAAANRISPQHGGAKLFEPVVFSPGRTWITTRHGARYRAKSRLSPGPTAALIVPGLGLAGKQEIEDGLSSPGTGEVLRWLRKHAESFPVVAASCSATFLLAEAGLLDGKIATTSWWLAPVFRSRYPAVELDERRMVTESGRFLCAGAALAQMDLMLHLIARLSGPALATRVASALAIEGRPSQSRYMMSSALVGLNSDVTRAERWVREHLDRAISVPEMARSLGMSSRTLDRRLRRAVGVGPSRFVQRLRAEHASHLIETTDLTLDEIAGRVGYADTASLRRVIRRERHASPSTLRAAILESHTGREES